MSHLLPTTLLLLNSSAGVYRGEIATRLDKSTLLRSLDKDEKKLSLVLRRTTWGRHSTQRKAGLDIFVRIRVT